MRYETGTYNPELDNLLELIKAKLVLVKKTVADMKVVLNQ